MNKKKNVLFFSVLFKGRNRTKEQKNEMFFSREQKRMDGTEQKRTDGTERSFQRNGKERTELNVLFKGMEKNGRNGTFLTKEWKRMDGTEHSLQKNGCPSLLKMS